MRPTRGGGLTWSAELLGGAQAANPAVVPSAPIPYAERQARSGAGHMDEFEDKSKRDLLAGVRTAVRALEEKEGFILKLDGKIANKERAEELRRETAYLEAVLPPKGAR